MGKGACGWWLFAAILVAAICFYPVSLLFR